MTAKRKNQRQTPKQAARRSAHKPAGDSEPPRISKAPARTETSESGLPGGGQGRVDITGISPQGIKVDPNITEGHPGYEESGPSEIVPLERLGAGESVGRRAGRRGSRT
jgi:hypothetical protein